jgi:hypothetical protein
MQTHLFQINYVPDIARWRIRGDDDIVLMTTEEFVEAATPILSKSDNAGLGKFGPGKKTVDVNVRFGPFTFHGVPPAQYARMQEYLQMLFVSAGIRLPE